MEFRQERIARVHHSCFDQCYDSKSLFKHNGVPDQARALLVQVLSAFTRFCLFETDHHAIGAKRQLQSLAPRIQFHGDAIGVAQP